MDNFRPLTLCVLAFLGGGRQNLLDQQASLHLREEGEEVRGLGGVRHSVCECGGEGALCGAEVRREGGPAFPAALLLSSPVQAW